jgi:transposase-like protein
LEVLHFSTAAPPSATRRTFQPPFTEHFPRDEAATKLIYLALQNITRKCKNLMGTWRAAISQFAIQFGSRFLQSTR